MGQKKKYYQMKNLRESMKDYEHWRKILRIKIRLYYIVVSLQSMPMLMVAFNSIDDIVLMASLKRTVAFLQWEVY